MNLRKQKIVYEISEMVPVYNDVKTYSVKLLLLLLSKTVAVNLAVFTR